MGNLSCVGEKDEAWKQQNKEMEANPAYQFVNFTKGGSLIDAYNNEGPQKVVELARSQMSAFLYNIDGKTHNITEAEFLRWKWRMSQKAAGSDTEEKISDEKLKAEYANNHINKFTAHDACWDLNKRGGVGETPFHLLFLMDSPVHFEVAKILLILYPNLALDVYEGEEYYGESALHIAVVVGDFELVQLLVESGADVNQRATGRFFMPEDQKKLYTGRTNYEGYAYYGEYPLAFAASLGKTEIYDYLLEHGANPDLQDLFGNTILHMVVISDQADMYRYVLRHHKIKASTSIKNNQNLTPMALACKLGRYSIFKQMLDLDSIEFWRFSTTLCSAHPLHTLDTIATDGSTNWNSALMIIVNGEKDDHLDMLDGGVMRQLLIEKWKTFAKKQFIIRLVLAVTHIILFSICVYTRPMGHLLVYRDTRDAVRYVCEVIVLVNCLVKVMYEIVEVFRQGINTFINNCTHAPDQTVYLVSCLLLLACLPCRLTKLSTVEDILVILAAPCVWSSLLFFARGHTLTGPFVTMIYKMIVGDLVRFGIIYVIFLAAFTQVFFFLFRDVKTEVDNSDLDKFTALPEAILKIFQMSFGEFKYDVFSLAHYSPLAKTIFGLFMILVPILLLNMLIAMMGNTHLKIISKSTKEWWKQWAKILVVLESGISKKKLLEYQSAYSVRLGSGPPPADGGPPPPDQRALVVLSLCSKSKAKKRKEAVFRWKALSREIIHQLRHTMYQGDQFELTESRSKGQLLNSGNNTLLTSTVTQLAWVQDIDLTKGHSFLTDKDSVHSYSLSAVLVNPGEKLTLADDTSVLKANVVKRLDLTRASSFLTDKDSVYSYSPSALSASPSQTPPPVRDTLVKQADRQMQAFGSKHTTSLTPAKHKRKMRNKIYPLFTTEREEIMANSLETSCSFDLEDSETEDLDIANDQLGSKDNVEITPRDRSPVVSCLTQGYLRADRLQRADGQGRTSRLQTVALTGNTDRLGATDKLERTDRLERANILERPDMQETAGTLKRTDRLEEAGRLEKADRLERIDKLKRSDILQRVDRLQSKEAQLGNQVATYLPSLNRPGQATPTSLSAFRQKTDEKQLSVTNYPGGVYMPSNINSSSVLGKRHIASRQNISNGRNVDESVSGTTTIARTQSEVGSSKSFAGTQPPKRSIKKSRKKRKKTRKHGNNGSRSSSATLIHSAASSRDSHL